MSGRAEWVVVGVLGDNFLSEIVDRWDRSLTVVVSDVNQKNPRPQTRRNTYIIQRLCPIRHPRLYLHDIRNKPKMQNAVGESEQFELYFAVN